MVVAENVKCEGKSCADSDSGSAHVKSVPFWHNKRLPSHKAANKSDKAKMVVSMPWQLPMQAGKPIKQVRVHKT
ncbi:hypothetical protein [Neisseria meningitidis]|uniref:hypothetical protein n=1 Tax=Neisseria meningitidis TaxID=487 RepID=UPI003F682492